MDEGKAVDVVYQDFSKACDTPSTDSSWRSWLHMVWAHALLGETLAGRPSPKNCGQWSKTQLAASHERCPSELSTRATSI